MSGHRTTVDQRELVLRRHLNSIGDVPELTPAEELAAAAVVADGRSAENELAALAGVTAILLSSGDEALVRAVDRYDPTGGLPFSSFARWWVERAMRDVERNPSGRTPAADNGTPAVGLRVDLRRGEDIVASRAGHYTLHDTQG